MTPEQIKEIMKQSLDRYGCGYFGLDDLSEDFTEVEESGWEQDHKYQYSYLIVKDTEGNFFQINNNRSGSPFTDWEYGSPDVIQVKPVEKTIVTTTWENV